ncbi:MAG TPA: glycosyltransferase family 4 protein [Hyphomicrobium sp.]|nr:glycosyltransferase family 4 protein [Hyphomicrobium sp.]
MRIAQIAPLIEAVPPKLYGGTERVISWLTEALVEHGHDVTLFASGDSETSAKLVSGWPRALRLDGSVSDANALHMAMLEMVAQRSREFDLLHFHLDYYPFSLFSRLSTPFVTTLHGRLDLPEHRCVFEAFPKAPVVSISQSQRGLLPTAPWAGTVLHGMPEDLLSPVDTTPSYLAFLGRISPEKGIERAIRVARRSGIPLKIAAKVDKADHDYFEEKVRPMLSEPGVEFIGEISDSQKAAFLSGAVALLMLIDWPEPFGLVMIEAMACGTPVIAFGLGAVPEIIDDGTTGFVVGDEDAAVHAVGKLLSIPRANIRPHFERRFTSWRMAGDYLDIYANVIGVADRRARRNGSVYHWPASEPAAPQRHVHRQWEGVRGPSSE